MANLKVYDADGNAVYLSGSGAGTSGDPLVLNQSVVLGGELPAGDEVIGVVGINTSANTVKIDASNNIVGLSTSANTVKIDSANNTVSLSTGGNTVKIDPSANGVSAAITAGEGDIADGACVTLGSTGDAVVDAGAEGTVSAKLRRISADLDALLTELKIKVNPDEVQLVRRPWVITTLLVQTAISDGDPDDVIGPAVDSIGDYVEIKPAVIVHSSSITAGSLDVSIEQSQDAGSNWYRTGGVTFWEQQGDNVVLMLDNTADRVRVRTSRSPDFAGNITIEVTAYLH